MTVEPQPHPEQQPRHDSSAAPVGLFPNYSWKKYKEDPGVNHSSLKHAWESWFTYKMRLDYPDEVSAPPLLNQAYHPAVLEPEAFRSDWATLPPGKTRASKEAKALEAIYGRNILTDSDAHQLIAWRTALLGDSEFQRYWSQRDEVELSAFWPCSSTDIRRKARIDLLLKPHLETVLDLKLLTDISDRALETAVWSWQYAHQAATYLQALRELGRPCKHYLLVCQAKAFPYEVVIRRISDEAIEAADSEIEEKMIELKRCQERNVWPARSAEGVKEISRPAWARRAAWE